MRTTAGPAIRGIKFLGAMGDRAAYMATVKYPGEPVVYDTFYGPTRGVGPVYLVSECFSVWIDDPGRFGEHFNHEWIREFYTAE